MQVQAQNEQIHTQLTTNKMGCFGVIKRLFWALMLPLGLFVLALLILSVSNEQTANTLGGWLKSVWWYVTAVRVLVYIFIVYGLIAFVISERQQNAEAEITRLASILDDTSLELSQSDINDIEQQQSFYQYQASKLATFRAKRVFIFASLLLMDMLLLQIPYALF